MVLVLMMFAAPLIVAALAITLFPDWKPETTTNNGDLVQPVRKLPAFNLESVQGKAIDETFLRGKWTILYLAKGACERPCVEQLYNIRQIRLAQGKNIDRLRRLMLWDTAGVTEAQRQELQEHFPGQVIVPAGDQKALLQSFALDEQEPLEANRIYLIDPLGNLMMKYDPGEEPRGMIKDLEKLLKYSGLG
jgi:cytochrome oxidase Cu insertion factor (SCO1/SenC/PrrC family)